MEEKELYCFTSIMEKEDYKKFLYFITFKKSRKTIWALITLALVSCMLLSFFLRLRSIGEIAGCFIFMLIISLSFLLLKIEGQAKALYSANPQNEFQKEQTVTLYETRITATNRTSNGVTSTDYGRLSKIYELPDYLILYFNEELASLIRRKDLPSGCEKDICRFLEQKLEHRYIKH